MDRNIEIKAKVSDIASLLQTAEAISGTKAEVIVQRDTFFNSSTGRLKLRELKDGSAKLISYLRENSLEPVASNFCIYPTNEPDLLRDTLQKTLGIRGEVRKTRHLFLVGRTRIHVDDVENLGVFMELEVVLSPDDNPHHGEKEAKQMM